MPCHVPRWGLRGLVDRLNLSGNERLEPEPSASQAIHIPSSRWELPFAGRFGSSLFWGAGQRQIHSFISTFRENHSWKRNPASCLPAVSEPRALGPKGMFQKQSLSLHLSASTVWLCILCGQRRCIDAAVPHALRCPQRAAHARVPAPVWCHVRAHPASLRLGASLGLGTQATSVLAEVAGLGWELWSCSRQAGSSDCRQSSPVFPADLGTMAGRDQPRR